MMVETLPLKYTKRMTMYLLVRVSTIQLHDMHACMHACKFPIYILNHYIQIWHPPMLVDDISQVVLSNSSPCIALTCSTSALCAKTGSPIPSQPSPLGERVGPSMLLSLPYSSLSSADMEVSSCSFSLWNPFPVEPSTHHCLLISIIVLWSHKWQPWWCLRL